VGRRHMGKLKTKMESQKRECEGKTCDKLNENEDKKIILYTTLKFILECSL
jgi:hypothetical protein